MVMTTAREEMETLAGSASKRLKEDEFHKHHIQN